MVWLFDERKRKEKEEKDDQKRDELQTMENDMRAVGV